jgi:hypothetical protein
MEVVAHGGDPLGVNFDPANALVRIRSGNFERVAGAPTRADATSS